MERVLNVATPTEALKDEPMCFVCRQEYQSVGSGMETHLDSLSQLPGAYGTTFVEQTFEAVRTPCGHVFCISCLSAGFKRTTACPCTMCRRPIEIPFLSALENTDDDLSKDVAYMKRHNPIGLITAEPRLNDVKAVARFDTPLAKYEDALRMY